jgi:hypothetical protein
MQLIAQIMSATEINLRKAFCSILLISSPCISSRKTVWDPVLFRSKAFETRFDAVPLRSVLLRSQRCAVTFKNIKQCLCLIKHSGMTTSADTLNLNSAI